MLRTTAELEAGQTLVLAGLAQASDNCEAAEETALIVTVTASLESAPNPVQTWLNATRQR
jgi:hypothetical protein